jgi:hypothetical protein
MNRFYIKYALFSIFIFVFSNSMVSAQIPVNSDASVEALIYEEPPWVGMNHTGIHYPILK